VSTHENKLQSACKRQNKLKTDGLQRQSWLFIKRSSPKLMKTRKDGNAFNQAMQGFMRRQSWYKSFLDVRECVLSFDLAHCRIDFRGYLI
jgi:hypothetical protein